MSAPDFLNTFGGDRLQIKSDPSTYLHDLYVVEVPNLFSFTTTDENQKDAVAEKARAYLFKMMKVVLPSSRDTMLSA